MSSQFVNGKSWDSNPRLLEPKVLDNFLERMNTIMFGFVLFLLSKKMLKKIKFVLGAIVGSS